MTKSPTLGALRRKRAEIAGSIRDFENKAHARRRDLADVDAALKLLDPNEQASRITPVRIRRPSNRIFARKELPIRVMAILREAERGWETSEAIAAKIMTDKGLNDLAGPSIRTMVRVALRSLEKRGIVVADKASGRWALKP